MGTKILMVKHRDDDQEYWCLPGGAVEPGETPEHAVIRELEEECGVKGKPIQQLSYHDYGDDGGITVTFLVDIGTQTPHKGKDPEFEHDSQILVEVAWLSLEEIPERDRTFLWAAGLLGVPEFFSEVEKWGDDKSYPR
jgi:ADP-ribose pyrophosphatase YjhB (NUDIX family)